MLITIAAFLLALLIALGLMPLMSVLARRIGLVDHPDKHRKLHVNAIPMVGGPTIFIATPLAAISMIWLGMQYGPLLNGWTDWISAWVPMNWTRADVYLVGDDLIELAGLWVAAFVLLLVGLADDRFGIRGRQKLLGQILTATILVIFGYHFDHVTAIGMRFEFGIFAVLIVYFWVVAAINSVNLLDGADGIASTIGIVMSLALCAMALIQGRIPDAIVAASIAGSLLGFLRFNFPPAKAYLGDSGSMLIGLLLSALAIRCAFKQPSAYAFFAPIALLAIPFIDTAAAIIRRRLTGRSIFTVDRGHLHHALMKRGYSPRVSLLWVALLCMTTAAGGVMALAYRQSEYALVSIGIVVVVMMFFRIFGVAEYQLIAGRANSAAKSMFRLGSKKPLAEILESTVHVQGTRDWQDVWKLLCDFADEHCLNQMTLDLNAPWLHESFHATRRRSDVKRGEASEWFSLIPLIVGTQSFGRVEIHGGFEEKYRHAEVIRNLLKVTEDIERSLLEPQTVTLPQSKSQESPVENVRDSSVRDSTLTEDSDDSVVVSSTAGERR
jgi:UDP-GlcNAc:undecaprenyl-phosphate GlcNAc-1-phosphate transferase